MKSALTGTDTAAIKAATEELTQAFYKISEKLYQQAGGPQGAGFDPSQAGGFNGGAQSGQNPQGGAGGAAVALTIGALLHPGHGDLFLTAEGCFLKAYVQAGAQVLALTRGVGVAARAAEAAAKQVAEDIAKAAEAAKIPKAAKTAAVKAGVGIEGCMAILVILLPLFLIGEHRL